MCERDLLLVAIYPGRHRLNACGWSRAAVRQGFGEDAAIGGYLRQSKEVAHCGSDVNDARGHRPSAQLS